MPDPAISALPATVHYVKLGEGGRWWKSALEDGRIHFGWRMVPADVVAAKDLAAAEAAIRPAYSTKSRATTEVKAFTKAVDRPSRHLWVALQDDCLWWCTVKDDVTVNPEGEQRDKGHFWLDCDRSWSNRSLGGRLLAFSNLPGIIVSTAGFRGTVCEPGGWEHILRVIEDRLDPAIEAATATRRAYEEAVAVLVTRLRDKDFEVLVDLILSRTGWVRLDKVGGTREGVDVEAENPATGEMAFVQVKSTAGQAVLDRYVGIFQDRRERYDRMIFAVHTAKGELEAPAEELVQIWSREKIAELVVKLGLGDWVAGRI